MTLLYVGNVMTSGIAVTLANWEDDLIVPAGTHVISGGDDGVYGQDDSRHRVTVAGTVAAYDIGIRLGNAPDFNWQHEVTVLEGGIVSGGGDAVRVYASGTLTRNFGSISGADGVVVWSAGDLGLTTIRNHGTITAKDVGIKLWGDQEKVVYNSGLVEAEGQSYVSFDLATDRLVNSGIMQGDVQLGGGNDLYNGSGGRVTGTVFGQDGDDRFVPGASAEIFDGGAGIDTLDFRGTDGVKVALDDSMVFTATAAGDTYSGIEDILGSRNGADDLTGDDFANALFGLGGADVLIGGGGGDRLAGGARSDTLSGGLGSDFFVFAKPSEGGDQITDFTNAGRANNDSFSLSAAGFGGGLVGGGGTVGVPLAAAQFQTRADTLAQDADDRFIFNTTDTTLWFDSNGNAAGGLTLVADLQAGAVVTYLDILLV
jgi:Ca2+-binding RTX toxin-like protein